MRKNNKFRTLLLILIFLTIAAFKFSYTDADPDLSLTWSASSFLTDELYHGGNALNLWLGGKAELNDFNYILILPLMPLMEYLSFLIFDPSLFSLRLSANVLSLILMLALIGYVYVSQKKIYDAGCSKNSVALLALFLIGSNYYFFIYGKMALLDIPMAAFGFLSLFMFLHAGQTTKGRQYRFYIFAGIMLAAALLIKTSAVNFILALLIYLLMTRFLKSDAKINRYGFLATLVVAVLLYAIVLLTVRQFFQGATEQHAHTLIFEKIVFNPVEIIRLFAGSLANPFVRYNWPLFVLMLFNLVILIKRGSAEKTFNPYDLMGVALLVSTFLFHGMFNYHPPRYYLVLSIPLAYFTATLPVNLAAIKDTTERSIFANLSAKKIVVFAIILIMAANARNLYDLTNYLRNPDYTLRDAGRAVARDMHQYEQTDNTDHVILFDDSVHTSIPFIAGVQFNYGSNYQDYRDAHSIYIINPAEQIKREYRLQKINDYLIYGRYMINLYKLQNTGVHREDY